MEKPAPELNIGVLVLAAGASSRFGSDKRQAETSNGKTVLQATLTNIAQTGLSCVLALKPEDELLNLEQSGVTTLVAPRAAQGMGFTLADSLPGIERWDGVLVMLADMPWIEPQTILTVAKALRRDNIIAPSFSGKRGHPVGFGRDFFSEFASLQGDEGAKAVVVAHIDKLELVEVEDKGVLQDIDVPEDLQQLSH